MSSNLGPLGRKDTVVIIGGGPAGTSCGIMLRRLAYRKRVPLRVILFEPKDFTVEQNICTGVLSPPFQRLLRELELDLPEGIVQRHISGYMLHSSNETIFLEDTSENTEPTLVVDRGNLDNFLLESARAAGVIVMDDVVVDVRPSTDKVLVISSGGARALADVVVGAFGLNSYALNLFEIHVPGYHRPRMTKSILTDIPLSPAVIDARFDNAIHALLLDSLPRIEFGALTPKRDHVTVNIVGDNIVDEDLDAFLELPWTKKLIPETTAKYPRFVNAFPSSPAKRLYRDRFVTIGNTSGLLRPLKGKGINTGIITGIEAAKTMMEVGISQRAFDDFYRRCHALAEEYHYGVILRKLYHLSLSLKTLDAVLSLARSEPLLYQAFYDMISGEGSYQQIIKRSARPGLAAKIVLAVIRHWLRWRSDTMEVGRRPSP